MSRALVEGAYLAAWCLALIAALALADRLITRLGQQEPRITAADRYAADEARRRALKPPDHPRSPLTPSERARFAAIADGFNRPQPSTTPGSPLMDKITYFRRRLELLTATDRDAPVARSRWMQRLAPVERRGVLHIAHPETGECLCGRAAQGLARPGDDRQVCADCGIFQNALANAEIQARSNRSWNTYADAWKRALDVESEVSDVAARNA